jgi:LysM repeat protein
VLTTRQTTRQTTWAVAVLLAVITVTTITVNLVTPSSASAHTSQAALGQTSYIPSAAYAPTTPSMPAIAQASSCGTYVVRAGDYLSSIAARVGNSWQNLAAINHLSNPNLIYPGQRLALCGTATTSRQPSFSPQTSSAMSFSTAGEPCQSNVFVAGAISQWAIPPGCYAGVYRVNPANYVARGSYGWCTWWAMVRHPGNPNLLNSPRSSVPSAGAAIVFAPGEQGASSAGHWGQVVAVLGNGWLLISEMNNSWRGGFALVSYRYVRVTGGTSFVY